ncbi:MAG: NUDIX hydrolase [Brachymonas sp.]|jgi:ADP-ribose pyrophosphatase YjhB (NUDIX family)
MSLSTPVSQIRYCRQCGHAVEHRLPDDGDKRPRAICPACGTVHYENPLLVVGTLPYTADGRVLLCQRAIEPRKGYWTLPAGFMELGESASAGAQRETEEESGASVRMGQLFSLLSVPRVGQVHLFYLAPLQNENFAPDPNETLAVRLLAEADIDWHSIAFTTVRLSLQAFFADFKTGSFGLHTQDVV